MNNRWQIRFVARFFLLATLTSTAHAQSNSDLGDAIDQWWDTKPNVSAVVILRGGQQIYERYERNQKATDLMPIYSVTKSVASILAGIAIDQGHIKTLDTPISQFLGAGMKNLSASTRAITIRHVLTMSTGLKTEWSMLGRPITSYRGDLDNKALQLPQTNPPGEVAKYNTLVSNLMAPVIERATGQELEAFAKQYLFAPLGITEWSWYRDDTKRTTVGSGLRLKTTDMARIGQLILNDGIYNGKRLLSKSYLRDATSAQVQIEFPGAGRTGYGYLFWQSRPMDRDHFIAAGYAQQIVYGIRDLDLVVAVSATCCSAVKRSARHLVEQHLVPALTK